MPDLTITLIQTDLFWEDVQANLQMLDQKVDGITRPTDLIILPEMFSTGFSMAAARLAETMNGPAVSWLRKKAADCGAAIAGSLMIREDDHFFNRLVCSQPDGRLIVYDKRHLFGFAGEDKVYTAGRTHIDLIIRQWRIRPFICYDLRFPVWTRNLGPAYDLSVFVANWPSERIDQWQILLQARAVENQAYAAGVNRAGRDGRGNDYSGASMVVSPRGRILLDAGDGPGVHTISLSREALHTYRRQFPVWRDADQDLGMILKTR